MLGYYPNLLSHLQSRFNFTVIYLPEQSGRWGSPSELGPNTSSILKTLHSGESAFTFPWVCTHARAMEFDCMEGHRVKLDMYMIESGSKVTMDMVFRPFTTGAWASMVLFFLTLAFGYHAFSRSRDSIQYIFQMS